MTPCAAVAQSITHQIALPAGETWCDNSMIVDLFNQINAFRTQNGASALRMDPLGMKDAEIRATQFIAYMATHAVNSPGFNPHTGYDTTAASLGYDLVSENLAYMNSSPAWIVYVGWQDTFHLNALLASANVVGVSCVYSASGMPFWTYEPGRGSASGSTTPPGGGGLTLDSEESAFLNLINNFRAQNGAGPLQISAALENSSRWMSNDMATNNLADHTDSLGRDPHTRMAAFGYPYSPWGENILGGYSDAQNAFNGWANACDADATGRCTYAHRLNMLNAGFRVIGIGRAYGPNSSYRWYWTTDFGGVVDQTIDPTPGPTTSVPVISSFTASPASITAGQPVSLSWNVSGATSISIDNGVGNVTSLTSKTVSPTQATTYTLTATNSSGGATARVAVTIKSAADTQPPTAPSILSAIVKSPTEVDLTWSASVDNTGVAGYQILRSGLLVAVVSSAQLSYADTSVSANTSYTYFLRAFDAAGNYSILSNGAPVTAIASSGAVACPPPATNAFTGCYYPNITLTGSPVFTRTDSQIYFTWGNASPNSTLQPNNFSVRWQGNFSFAQGTYTFNVLTSDGMRLYVDGKLLLDYWRDQPPYGYSASQTLGQGNHLIVVEYYERTNGAVARVSWQKSASPGQAPVIASLAASPTSVVPGQPSTLSWSVSGASSITLDNGLGDVTAASSKTVSPVQTTTYTLTATNSSGSVSARVTVTVGASSSGPTLTAPSILSAIAKTSGEVDLTWSASGGPVAGYQILRSGMLAASVPGSQRTFADTSVSANTIYFYFVRSFDSTGKTSSLSNGASVTTLATSASASCPAPATNAFTACYYPNITLSGNPTFIRTDSQINFMWGNISPDKTLDPNNFSARWQGSFSFAQGTYTFNVLTSDGMRLYVDGKLILDYWRDQPPYGYTVSQTLSQGSHLIVVEYYERTNGSVARVSWQRTGP